VPPMPMKPKKIHKNDITGQMGINLIEKVVLDMGFLWYPTGGIEAGIDGWIEIRDSETGEVLNSIIQVQSKATMALFQTETAQNFQYLCDERDLDYWLRGNAPVILVVSRPSTSEAYWVSIKDYFRDPVRRKARKVIFDKKRDRFDAGSKDALIRLAVPADAGIYLSPPPKHEQLYSNLLLVTRFFDTIYAADTEYRTPGELGAALKQHIEYPSWIWLLKDKRLYSPHNLAEPPWTAVCDASSIETIDAKHWAFSADDSQRRDFVRLLNGALKDKLGALRVGYSRLHRCYYFKASKDLSLRRYRYRSLQHMAVRVVVTRYTSAKNPEVVWFRHCAFEDRFRLFDGTWYLEISPTYYFTRDGILPWRFYEEWLSGIKRKQKNHAVLGEVIMWARLLEEPHDLFLTKHPFLGFGQLQVFDVDAGIYDTLWLPSEQAIQAEKEPDLDPSDMLSETSELEEEMEGSEDGSFDVDTPRQLPFRFGKGPQV
jgi:hypothetical protein